MWWSSGPGYSNVELARYIEVEWNDVCETKWIEVC